MPSLLTTKYKTFLAEQFLDGLDAETFTAYLFLGQPVEWVDSSNASVNDSNPPTPESTVQAVDFVYWRDMLGAKRISASNSALVIARRDWETGTVYDQYDDQEADMGEFYVLDTQEEPYKVYKCLWNNSGGESNVAPSSIGTAVNPQATLDGYVWQYLYTVEGSNLKFLTDSWMPVLSNSSVVENASTYAGRLPTAVPLLITDEGLGYNSSVTVTTTLIGDGTGATVLSEGVTIVGGVVESITLSAGGLGYTEVTSVNVYQSGVTSQAQARAIIPPYPNHGYDPVKELGATKVMSVVQFANTESGELTVDNNFRRVGLLISPIDANTAAVANGSYYRQTWDVTYSANTGAISPDDEFYNLTNEAEPSGIVVDANSTVMRLTSVFDAGESTPFANGDVLKCDASGVEVTVSEVSEPQLELFSGSVVYINQRTPVTRSATQTEDIKLVIPFG